MAEVYLLAPYSWIKGEVKRLPLLVWISEEDGKLRKVVGVEIGGLEEVNSDRRT